ncbi:hypothetical protein TSAR_014833 [Trichomalopsis sarcophagae]|uniref:DUF4817 domain-containing protein n=1 Tax=Trichomalopsis sarcophagae TaxID=543379 RepID=A0A232EM81_9HYME|nr:hypothetical protein TSAR_014833 [Trichomalopsis sarcophagae]
MTSVSSHGFYRTGFLMRKMANYTPNEVVDILITLGECGRKYRRTARTYLERFPNRRHAVLAMVHLNSHISTRELGVPRSTFYRWLQTVNYHPYHITLVQELSEADYVLMIGPHFFERTINGPMYLEFLENDLPRYLENVPLKVRLHLWYQQDGAPVHYARDVRTFLNQRFPNRWIHLKHLEMFKVTFVVGCCCAWKTMVLTLSI